METMSSLTNIRVTPRKLAVIADEVRGKSVANAMNYLALSPRRRVAALISKVQRLSALRQEQKGLRVVF